MIGIKQGGRRLLYRQMLIIIGLLLFVVAIMSWRVITVDAGTTTNGNENFKASLAYGFYHNTDNVTPGIMATAQRSMPWQLGSKNQPFRLRTGLAASGDLPVESIAVGNGTVCALASGEFYCWGENSNGQLGDGTTTSGGVPVVPDRTGVLSGKTILRGATNGTTNFHTCAIASDNLAYCWGSSANGQLGYNSTVQSTVPVAVSTAGVLSGKTVLAISTGFGNTCAVASDNLPYCWGINSSGQLGNNSTTQSNVPVAVVTSGALVGKTVLKLATGANHSCVIASNNLAYCWGSGGNGRLGNGATGNSLVPVAVNTAGVLAGKTILQIATGSRHSCAIANDNLAYCWGRNTEGQLGDNTITQRTTPVAVNTAGVLAGKTILSIAAGGDHTCVIANDNKVYCWGRNIDGEIGDGSTTQRNIPTAVDTTGPLSGKTISQVSVGETNVCVKDTNGEMYCWGSNTNGRLSSNTSIFTPRSSYPVTVTSLVSRIPASSNNYRLQYAQKTAPTCSVQASGYANVTAGTPISYYTNPSVSDGTSLPSGGLFPYSVYAERVSPQTYISSGASSFTNTTDIPPNKTGYWDFALYDNNAPESTTYCLRIAYADGTPLEQTTVYPEITTADINLKGSSYRFYQNQDSLTPGAPLASDNTPVLLSAIDSTFRLRTGLRFDPPSALFKSIDGGSGLMCGINMTDAVYCWGNGTYGQLGNNTNDPSWMPVPVDTSGVLSGKTIKSLSVAYGHVCAVASDNLPYCWGTNWTGQLGNNSIVDSSVPVAVDTTGVLSGKTIKSVSTLHFYGTCAIASDDQVYCWGNGTNGELGNNSTVSSYVPVAVDTSGALTGKTIKKIAGGSDAICAIASDDQVYCWGNGTNGELGNNSPVDSSVPVAVDTSGVLAGKTILSIDMEYSHACVVASDFKVYCWGANWSGQLGNNSTIQSNVPVAVDTSGVLAGKTIIQVSVGESHTCAISSDNKSYCWGDNSSGNLGNNSIIDSSVPVAVDMSGVLANQTLVQLTMQESWNSCVLTQTNQVFCWGDGWNLGNGEGTTDSPVPVLSATPYRELSSGIESFRLQYATKTAGSCTQQSTGFANVTNSTPIAWNTNPNASHGATISTFVNDPVADFVNNAQSYISSDASFTNANIFSNISNALYDFSLRDNNAPDGTTYCLRIAYANGSPLEQGSSSIAELTTATAVHSTPTISNTAWNGGTLTVTGFYDPANTQSFRVRLTPGGQWYSLGSSPELTATGSSWTLTVAGLNIQTSYSLQAEAVALDGAVLASAITATNGPLAATGDGVRWLIIASIAAVAAGLFVLFLHFKKSKK